MQTIVDVTLPLRLISESNVRECWQAKWRRSRLQKKAIKLAFGNAFRRSVHTSHSGNDPEKIVIELCRIGVKKIDQGNLEPSFKSVQDEIAAIIGINDGAYYVTWIYKQDYGYRKKYAVNIKVFYE